MTIKPESLKKIWSEREVIEYFHLPVQQIGSYKQLDDWITDGLPYTEKNGLRYFFEQDIIDYLWNLRKSL